MPLGNTAGHGAGQGLQCFLDFLVAADDRVAQEVDFAQPDGLAPAEEADRPNGLQAPAQAGERLVNSISLAVNDFQPQGLVGRRDKAVNPFARGCRGAEFVLADDQADMR